MKKRLWWSLGLFLACGVVTLIVDFVWMAAGGVSFSRATLTLITEYPIVAFSVGMLIGVLAGHWAWPLKR